MMDILKFNTFIAPDILIFFYYIGAIVIPFILYRYKSSLLQKFSFLQSIEDGFSSFFHSLSTKHQVWTIVNLLVMFLFMELFWRMMFEAVIGYFDMHNYLYEIREDLDKGV